MRTKRILAVAAIAVALAVAVTACGGSSSSSSGGGGSSSGSKLSGTINGAGATFPLPVYQEWAARLKDTSGLTVNYQGIGSGGGIAQFTAGTVDFGATDSAMEDTEVAAAKKKGDPVHVPSVFGAVTVSYNVQGLDKGLKLDGKTVADIFLGKIKKWDDPAIAGMNSGAKLPSTAITVCHRSDESGTTKLFTTFLADYSPEWKSGPGVDKTVKWPTGTGAKGNDGVAAAIKQTPGAVGYVEQAYALQNNFTYAYVKNSAGKYVDPTLQSVTAAGQGISVPSDLRFTLGTSKDPSAYPISSQTFIVVYKDPCKAGASQSQAKGLVSFLDYVLGPGQDTIKKLSYAPLPSQIDTKAKDAVKSLTCNGKSIA
jgi:phosphate transport system substrate-binding protein